MVIGLELLNVLGEDFFEISEIPEFETGNQNRSDGQDIQEVNRELQQELNQNNDNSRFSGDFSTIKQTSVVNSVINHSQIGDPSDARNILY